MNQERIRYAFGHMVAAHNPDDPHHADSGDLADETLREEGFSQREIDIVEVIAEHVAGDYAYTGEATELDRRIRVGEV